MRAVAAAVTAVATPARSAARATFAHGAGSRACGSARSAHAPADREPVVLRHSRIYILPTRRGWALIATLLDDAADVAQLRAVARASA